MRASICEYEINIRACDSIFGRFQFSLFCPPSAAPSTAADLFLLLHHRPTSPSPLHTSFSILPPLFYDHILFCSSACCRSCLHSRRTCSRQPGLPDHPSRQSSLSLSLLIALSRCESASSAARDIQHLTSPSIHRLDRINSVPKSRNSAIISSRPVSSLNYHHPLADSSKGRAINSFTWSVI